MYFKLLQHYWKDNARRSVWTNSIGIKIMIVLLILYFGVNFLVLGIFYPEIIQELLPGTDPLWLLNSVLIFYLFGDIAIRFLLQEFPELKIQNYLLLPIPRNTLFRYLMIRSGLTVFSFFPLLIFLPAFFRMAVPDYGVFGALCWLIGILLLITGNTWTAFYLKRIFGKRFYIPLIILGMFGLLAWANLSGLLPLNEWSAFVFQGIGLKYFWIIVPLAYFLLSGALLQSNFHNSSYFEGFSDQPEEANSHQFEFLKKYGMIGELIRMDLRLIFRNKRPKTTVLMTLVFLLYGFIFYTQESYQNDLMYLFWGVYFTGIVGLAYGQLTLSWESSFFEFLQLRSFDMAYYFRAKYVLFCLASGLTYLVTLPYAFFDWEIALFNTVCMLLNMGISFPLLIYFSSYNTKPIDLGKGSFFNTEGSNIKQFVVIIPILIGPLLVYAPFYVFGWRYAGLIILGSLGIIGIVLSSKIIVEAAKLVNRRKYKLVEAYRNR